MHAITIRTDEVIKPKLLNIPSTENCYRTYSIDKVSVIKVISYNIKLYSMGQCFVRQEIEESVDRPAQPPGKKKLNIITSDQIKQKDADTYNRLS